MTWRHEDPKPMGCSKSSSKREVYRNKAYLKKQETSRIDNLTLHLKQLEKEKQNKQKKTQSQQKERNHKDQIRNK